MLAFVPTFAAAAAEGGGFNPLSLTAAANAFWTIVIFLAALPFMWKIVWGPMAKALEERDHHADAAVQAAEEAKAGAEKARAEVEKQLEAARAEAAKQIADAKAAAEAQKRDIVAAAQAEAQRERERAKVEIEREKSKALAEIRETVVDLTLDAATRVVGRSFQDDDQRRFVREFTSAKKS